MLSIDVIYISLNNRHDNFRGNLLRRPFFAVQFLYIYPAVFADYVARLLRSGAVPAGTGGDGVVGAGVVLFLRLLGCSLYSFVVRLDLLELLVREADRGSFTQAAFPDNGR